MATHHLAQVNIARAVAPLDSPTMAGFVARIAELNALAEASPGFVWRFEDGSGSATYTRPFLDQRIIFNMSVWRQSNISAPMPTRACTPRRSWPP